MIENHVDSSPSVPSRVLRFGGFELDVEQQELRRRGVLVAFRAQPFKVLVFLAERAGEIVSRDEIRRHVWGEETFVDYEQGINACVRQIRQALRDDATSPRFLETVPRRGYRFIAPVEAERIEAVPEHEDEVLVEPAMVADSPAPRYGRWLTGVGSALAAVLAVLVVNALSAGSRQVSDPPIQGIEPSSRPLLAVLPFHDFSPGGGEQYLADGMTEELIARISQNYGGRLGVIARTSAMKYKETSKDLREIARELSADYLLEGSIRRIDDQVRFSSQLIRASDQAHLWAGSYDRRVEDLLAIESEVSDKIGQALALALRITPPGDPAGVAATRGDAYDAYLKGRHDLRRAFRSKDRPAVLSSAQDHLELAAELDPSFAPVYVSLASVHRALLEPREGRPRERRELEKALALDESLVEAHVALGLHFFYYEWDLEAAERSLARAIEVNPASARAHHQYAAVLSVTGRHDEAVASVERALRLDPLSPDVGSDVGWYFYFGRRYAEAVEHSRRTLEINPGFLWAKRCIILAATAQGDLETAVEEGRRDLFEIGVADADVIARIDGSDPEEALHQYWFHRLEVSRRRGAKVVHFASAHMALGQAEETLAALEQAYQDRDGWILPFLGVHPLFDPLRSDPRFQNLVERISSGRTP